MEYFYHYTTLKNWEKIQKEGLQLGSTIAGDTEGDASDLGYKPAIFGLPSPAPKNWLTHDIQEFGDSHPIPILTLLLDYIAEESYDALVLLKVRLLPSDDVRIGDYESIWRVYNDDSAWDVALTKYCRSVTNLQSQFNVASKKLPEVLCFNAIPANRIEFIKQIPAKTFEEVSAYVEKERKAANNFSTTAPSPPATGTTRPKRSAP